MAIREMVNSTRHFIATIHNTKPMLIKDKSGEMFKVRDIDQLGFPDVLVTCKLDRRCIGVEVKGKKTRVLPSQIRFREWWEASGQKYIIAREPNHMAAVLKALLDHCREFGYRDPVALTLLQQFDPIGWKRGDYVR